MNCESSAVADAYLCVWSADSSVHICDLYIELTETAVWIELLVAVVMIVRRGR